MQYRHEPNNPKPFSHFLLFKKKSKRATTLVSLHETDIVVCCLSCAAGHVAVVTCLV